MRDQDILKLKFGLATISVILLLTGSRLLFDGWTKVNWSYWLILALIIYGGIYPPFKALRNKNVQIIFNAFDIRVTIPLVGIIAMATIMLLIFYTHISLLFFGLGLATLSVVGGLKFIIFDEETIDGLFEDSNSSLKEITVNIQPDNNQIEIKTLDNDDSIMLKREKYSDRVWTALIKAFSKIKSET